MSFSRRISPNLTAKPSCPSAQLYRLRDRRGSEYILAPTHEEEVTKLVSTEVESWRSLPVKVYQISKWCIHQGRPEKRNLDRL